MGQGRALRLLAAGAQRSRIVPIGHRGQAEEQFAEIGGGGPAVALTQCDDRVEDSRCLARGGAANEAPVLPADARGADGSFGKVGVEPGDAAPSVADERRPLREEIAVRFALAGCGARPRARAQREGVLPLQSAGEVARTQPRALVGIGYPIVGDIAFVPLAPIAAEARHESQGDTGEPGSLARA